MARPEKEYQKLPGSGRPPFPASMAGGMTRLYLAKDHLLKVQSNYFTERYRRFYLKDIQVLRITCNRRAFWTNLILGVFVLLFLVITLFVQEPVARIGLGAWGAVFLIFLLVNLFRGPTCTTRIETSIGGEDLYSLNRLWRAEKVLGRLLPLIREAQGAGDPAALATQAAEGRPPALSFVDLPAQTAAVEEKVHDQWRWMGFAMGAGLLGNALASVLLLLFPGFWGLPTAIGLMLIAVVLDILLMSRPVTGCGRALTGTVLGWFCVYGGLLYALLIKVTISNQLSTSRPVLHTQYELYVELCRAGANQDGYLIFLLATSAAISGILGFYAIFKMLTTPPR